MAIDHHVYKLHHLLDAVEGGTQAAIHAGVKMGSEVEKLRTALRQLTVYVDALHTGADASASVLKAAADQGEIPKRISDLADHVAEGVDEVSRVIDAINEVVNGESPDPA